MRVILGIGGGIAAYKAAMLLRLFSESGHQVVPVPTRAALEFVGAATWEALSGEKVSTEVFDRVWEVNHVGQGQAADLIVVAPATADLLARVAHGHADDLLTTTILATQAPVLFAPAMHTEMWLNPAVQENVEILRRHGYQVLQPDTGRLTGQDSGPGRLPEPEVIYHQALACVESVRSSEQPLRGFTAVVSAGGTREALDPVRYLGNRSSGKQGIAVAQALVAAGATVELVAAHLEVPLPQEHMATAASGALRITRVSSAQQLHEAMIEHADKARIIVMTAAVADFRPAEIAATKIKKTDQDHQAPVLQLVRNPDILADLVQRRSLRGANQIIVGFAAETGDEKHDPVSLGRAKLLRKGCDLLCVNQVGHDLVFGQDNNAITILGVQQGDPVTIEGSKADVARNLVQHIAQLVKAP